MAPIIIHGLGLFLFILQELHCLQIFNITMHYPQWDYITVPSFMFTSAIVSEVRLLKRKKKKKEKMNNWCLAPRDFLIFNTFPRAVNYALF